MNGPDGGGEARGGVAGKETVGRGSALQAEGGHGVGDEQAVQGRAGNALGRLSGEEAVGGGGDYGSGPFLGTRCGRLGDRARRADEVVHDDGHAVAHGAHEPSAHDRFFLFVSDFLDEGGGHFPAERGPQPAGKPAGPLHAALVGRDDHDLLVVDVAGNLLDEEGAGLQVLGHGVEGVLEDGEVVHVHRQHPIDPHGVEEAAEVAGRDRAAGLALAVFALVAEEGHDGGDPPGGGVAERAQKEEQPAQLVIHAHARLGVERLDDENVSSPDVHLRPHLVLPVAEGLFVVGVERRVEGGGDGTPELGTFGGGEEAGGVGHGGE